MTIYSTSNLPKLLNGAKEDGWRILGAAAEVPDGVARDFGSGGSSNRKKGSTSNTADDDSEWDVDIAENGDGNAANDNDGIEDQQQQQCFELHTVDTDSPTILVLGSEGEYKVLKK